MAQKEPSAPPTTRRPPPPPKPPTKSEMPRLITTVEAADLLRAKGFGILHEDSLGTLLSVLACHMERTDMESDEEMALYQDLEARLERELRGIVGAKLYAKPAPNAK